MCSREMEGCKHAEGLGEATTVHHHRTRYPTGGKVEHSITQYNNNARTHVFDEVLLAEDARRADARMQHVF